MARAWWHCLTWRVWQVTGGDSSTCMLALIDSEVVSIERGLAIKTAERTEGAAPREHQRSLVRNADLTESRCHRDGGERLRLVSES